jgi:SAM-dependent methyltransferase
MAEADFKPQGGYKELLLGCGTSRVKRLKPEFATEAWQNLITLDMNPAVRPDVVHDLNRTPWPFQDNQFDEVHAYEVLEHLGQQGDYRSFFAHFEVIWRILKPGGYLLASTPSWDGIWAWSDPGHTRIISEGSLVFLDRERYATKDGANPMTDYRFCYRGDFTLEGMRTQNDSLYFVLKARK